MSRWSPKKLPAQCELMALFQYDPSSGVILWRRTRKPAGTRRAGRDGNRYLVIGIRRSYYKAHRIIWKLMTGQEPPEFIDHKDGDNFNNRWRNLRAADNAKNLQNAKLRSDNRSGVKGIHWDAGHKKWRAVISADGQSHRLGRYATVASAAAAINAARRRLHGNFARVA
jgi:hypothetical protein